MPEAFNPYLQWLGISSSGTRPSHYELLSLTPYESDIARIRSAAADQTAKRRGVRPGDQVEVWQRLLDELRRGREFA